MTVTPPAAAVPGMEMEVDEDVAFPEREAEPDTEPDAETEPDADAEAEAEAEAEEEDMVRDVQQWKVSRWGEGE